MAFGGVARYRCLKYIYPLPPTPSMRLFEVASNLRTYTIEVLGGYRRFIAPTLNNLSLS